MPRVKLSRSFKRRSSALMLREIASTMAQPCRAASTAHPNLNDRAQAARQPLREEIVIAPFFLFGASNDVNVRFISYR
jgi:hypothetical protein